MTGILNILLTYAELGPSEVLSTTVNVGSDTLYTTTVHDGFTNTTTYQSTGRGFDAGADYYGNSPNFGSISDDTYTDGGGNSRTITASYHSSLNGRIYFTLSGSVPNNEDTFFSIEIDGFTFERTDATSHGASNGGTHWSWSSNNRFGTSGSKSFKVVA